MKHNKKKLLKIAGKIQKAEKITPSEIDELVNFNRVEKEAMIVSILKKAAIPTALAGGFLIAVFPEGAEKVARALPHWANLSDPVLRGADYTWSIIGEPVGKNSILYHLPNIILYSFGVLGIKKLFDAIDRKTWVDKVINAKNKLLSNIEKGDTPLFLKKGHSVLFVGEQDFIGMEFAVRNINSSVVIATKKPSFTYLWNYYGTNSQFEDLKSVMDRVCTKYTGEYVFFPVKDDQIFLPGLFAYDISPHRLDILCQDIRSIEKSNKWKSRRIIIVGDKFHKSYVHSEDEGKKLGKSEDVISLQTISLKYPNVTIIDPTDIVLKEILRIADGRKIVFRATLDGINEYKNRFYKRLYELGYEKGKKSGILTIGYDLFEDQTEQQTLARKVDGYLPVVLSKSVKDALIRNGYLKDEFIYVPELVINFLARKASEQ